MGAKRPSHTVTLLFLLKVWAKKCTSEQLPDEYRKQVEKKLEPTPVALRNFGGGRLPVVRQTRVTISRSGYYVDAVVQIQQDAPAQLLIGTNLLSKLGFIFCVLNQKMRTKTCWSHRIQEAQVRLRKQCAYFELFDTQDGMQSLSELLHLMVTL